MKDVLLIHRMDESDRTRRMRFVTDGGTSDRADRLLVVLERANLSEEDIVFLEDGFIVRLTRKDVPRALRLVLDSGVDVYAVYEVYELYEA